jgi:DDE superfamily endonuclease
MPTVSAEFVCQMEEVLAVYERPFDPKRPVICLDESPRPLISEVKASFTDSHGVLHEDYEYKREGAADVYMVCEPLGGKRFVEVRDSHHSHQWARVIARIVEDEYPDAQRITLIQDNLKAHRKAALYEIFDANRARQILSKIEFVWTPVHGSWLNMAEIELSILARQGLERRIPNVESLKEQVAEWEKRRNQLSKKINWQFTNKDARIKLKRLYPSIIN